MYALSRSSEHLLLQKLCGNIEGMFYIAKDMPAELQNFICCDDEINTYFFNTYIK